MTEQIKLKPCPFCGGPASMAKSYDPDTSGAFHFIQCHKCSAKSPEFYAVETCPIFHGQVRDAWNARAAPTPQEAQRNVQVWNDAVEACEAAAWAEVQAMEDKAANGMPNPARTVVRAVGRLIKSGDERRVVNLTIALEDSQ